jgi:formylglycine-generating enzyme required for sulfatase activity
VTQAEWTAVTGANPSAFDGKRENEAKGLDTTCFPVEQVSWDDCQSFVKKLNESARDVQFRLPSEDEWEYACRAGKGNKQQFHVGGDLDETQANIGNPCLGRTAAVGGYAKRAPHPWGLCDMHGNVWEWCANVYDAKGPDRVNRGGSWGNEAKDCRSAYRNRNAPGTRSHYLGVRLVVVPSAP